MFHHGLLAHLDLLPRDEETTVREFVSWLFLILAGVVGLTLLIFACAILIVVLVGVWKMINEGDDDGSESDS